MTLPFKFAALAVAFAAGILSPPAHASSVNWEGEGGPNEFSNFSISFAGFDADTLVSITSQGYYFTNDGALNPV